MIVISNAKIDDLNWIAFAGRKSAGCSTVITTSVIQGPVVLRLETNSVLSLSSE